MEIRPIKRIIVHCSASDLPGQDSIESIKELHVSSINKLFTWGRYQTYGKGFSDIGYHFFIDKSGVISTGRNLFKIGAHCRDHNLDSIGVCLSGEFDFTKDQFLSLGILINSLRVAFGIPLDKVIHHNELNQDKSCPNFKLSEHLPEFSFASSNI